MINMISIHIRLECLDSDLPRMPLPCWHWPFSLETFPANHTALQPAEDYHDGSNHHRIQPAFGGSFKLASKDSLWQKAQRVKRGETRNLRAEIGCSALISCRSVITRPSPDTAEGGQAWTSQPAQWHVACYKAIYFFMNLNAVKDFKTRRVKWCSLVFPDLNRFHFAKVGTDRKWQAACFRQLLPGCPAFRCSEHQSLKCTQRLVYISTKWCWVVAWHHNTPHDMSPITAHGVKLFGKQVEAVHTTCL